MKKYCTALVSSLLLSFAYSSTAAPYYAGAGMSFNIPDNTRDYDFAGGYRIFGGYDLGIKIADIAFVSIEAGYYNTGSYKGKPIIDIVSNTISDPTAYSSSGLWTSAVFDFSLGNKMGAHAITGIDLGDDDGLILGAGVSYIMDQMIKLNADLIIKGESTSLQLNAAYHF